MNVVWSLLCLSIAGAIVLWATAHFVKRLKTGANFTHSLCAWLGNLIEAVAGL